MDFGDSHADERHTTINEDRHCQDGGDKLAPGEGWHAETKEALHGWAE